MDSKNLIIIFLLSLIFSCAEEQKTPNFKEESSKVFTSISSEYSNIEFKNTVQEQLYFNFLNYSYIYNGGGVAVGDINNDGLEDIYFVSNQESNKLYLNKGDFKFEDITLKAGVQDEMGWSTGVTMVDINNDGWLDIYVCKSGSLNNPQERQNKLFINQKDSTFREEAKQYGLNQHGYSTQAYFFDYDIDGDLDMYLVNHRADFRNNVKISTEIQRQVTQEDSDHLFRNDNGVFVNVTQQAGVVNKAWGLSASISDFNNDGLPDVFVANDFLEPDFLYINNGNGTFSDKGVEYFNHTSFNSMGSDIGDINNDLRPDLIVLDMMAADRRRGKENMATMSTDNFNSMVDFGYNHQYMSNVLQLNRGNTTFSEIGQFSGIAKTDWSWAPLIADFDNDGFNDVFVTNGIENDLSNQDFRNNVKQNIKEGKKMTLEEAIALMPSTKLSNYMFVNNKDFTFKDVSNEFGFDKKVNSNGVAYADFDNDGDLDLVVNNQSEKASIYKNNSNANYLKVSLKGNEKNLKGIGARVEVYSDKLSQSKEMYVSRGYQSSVSFNLNFGLGANTKVDSVKVIWNDNSTQTIKNININSNLELQYANTAAKNKISTKDKQLFSEVSAINLGVNYKHKSVNFNDYDLQLLLPQKQSTIDAALEVADVNNDGLDDLFIGNTIGYPSQLFIQNTQGKFVKLNSIVFESDKMYNDNNAIFFDVDNDNDLDLYIASGNYSQEEQSNLLQDRLYINNGKGQFSKGQLPEMKTVTKALAVNDFDNDGDLDLFVGGRVIPGKYPNAPESYFLMNNNGKLEIETNDVAPELKNIGLVNDALFSDYDNDGDSDLIIVGEWMSISVFDNDGAIFRQKELESNNIKGWFQTITAIDYDNDGDQDYFVGNYGDNNKFHPTLKKPLHIYANYFDDNKSYDTALSKEENGDLFPVRGKECSSQQTPFLNDKIETYKEFANSTIVDVYGESNINEAYHLEVTSFNSYYLNNQGNGSFEFMELPNKAQFGPTLAFQPIKINGKNNVVGIGSIYDAEVETIRYDASKGYVLNNDLTINNSIDYVSSEEVKTIKSITINKKNYLVLLNANKELTFLKVNN